MKIGKIEIRWLGYRKGYAKKMIRQIYTDHLQFASRVPAKIAAIKWHREYALETTGECGLKESKELVEKILGGIHEN